MQDSGGGPEGFAAFVREVRRFHVEYQPVGTPADLAQEAAVVVNGRVVGVEPGQQYAPAPNERPSIATSILIVEVEAILAGDEQLVHRGRVYVEVPHPAFVGIPGAGEPDTPQEISKEVPYDTSAFAVTVPRAAGVFFLQDRTDGTYTEHILNLGAGRPAGASLTTYYTQGLWLEDASGRLVSVAEPVDGMPPPWATIDTRVELLEALAAPAR